MLPKDYPKWQTVYGLFRKWKRRGIIKKIHDILRERVRQQEGRKKAPTAMIIDSQSVKTTDKRGGCCGFDTAKKIKGRKRHIITDAQGLLLKVKVHAADIMDRDGARLILRGVKKQYPTIQHLWLDAAYNGKKLNRSLA